MADDSSVSSRTVSPELEEQFPRILQNALHDTALAYRHLVELIRELPADDTQDTTVDESQDTRARAPQDTGTEEPEDTREEEPQDTRDEEPEALVPLPGFPEYQRYDYPGKGCSDWIKGPKESNPSASDRARACPNEHSWGVIWIGSSRKSCPGCGQQMPKSMGSKGEPIAAWDIPCEVGNDGKAIKGTGFAIQIKDTGRMSTLSKQAPKDNAKDSRASCHYNGMAARLKHMLVEQGLTEDEAEYHARFPFKWKDKNARAALQRKLDEWYARQGPDTENTTVPNVEANVEANYPVIDLTIPSPDLNQFPVPSNLSSSDTEMTNDSDDDDSDVDFSDSNDVTHGPFRHDIKFRKMPFNWEKKGGIMRSWWMTSEQRAAFWEQAYTESDLRSITINEIPNFLYHLVPLFARWTGVKINLAMTWQVRSVYTASPWYKERNQANFEALIKLLNLEAERWKELFASEDEDSEDEDSEDEEDDEDDGGNPYR